MRYAAITGWGKCIPPATLTNADLEKIVETSDDWITTRTGIKERHIAEVDTSDLATVASVKAMASAGVTADQIDMILLATCTPDHLIPSAASRLQAKLGAYRAGAQDLNAACAGFIYALVTGTAMIRSGAFDRILVVGAEKLSHLIDWTDRTTCVLFGDAAGAVVLEPSDEPAGVLSSELGLDGTCTELLIVPDMGTVGAPRTRDPRRMGIRMNGPEIFRRAVVAMGDASTRVVEEAGLRLEDVDLLIPHQANLRIIDATARRLKLDSSQVYVNIQSYGNTSAATIPVALAEAVEEGRVEPGCNIVFAAFGAGLTWAAAAVRWGDRVTPLGTSDIELPASGRSAMEVLEPALAYYGAKLG